MVVKSHRRHRNACAKIKSSMMTYSDNQICSFVTEVHSDGFTQGLETEVVFYHALSHCIWLSLLPVCERRRPTSVQFCMLCKHRARCNLFFLDNTNDCVTYLCQSHFGMKNWCCVNECMQRGGSREKTITSAHEIRGAFRMTWRLSWRCQSRELTADTTNDFEK